MSNADDELAIRRVLANYCRGLDRMDKPLSYSVFHADAPVNYHDIYEGTGHDFIDWVWEAHAGMERHSHQISNILVDINGDTAVSEAYVTVALWTLPDDAGKQQEIVGRGRYLDHWEKRDGNWAISAREHVLDMQTIHGLDGGNSSRGYINEQSRRDEQDRSYTLLTPSEIVGH